MPDRRIVSKEIFTIYDELINRIIHNTYQFFLNKEFLQVAQEAHAT